MWSLYLKSVSLLQDRSLTGTLPDTVAETTNKSANSRQSLSLVYSVRTRGIPGSTPFRTEVLNFDDPEFRSITESTLRRYSLNFDYGSLQ